MKLLLLPSLFAAAAVFAVAADTAPLSGKWEIRQSIAGNDSSAACTFTQNDKELTGTCNSAEGGTVKISGKVNDKTVSWTFNSEYNGTPLTVKYTGTLDSARITGTVSVEPFGVDGEFTATQSK